MCLLTVMSPYSIPTREELLRAATANPHGFGYAIMFEDRIVTSRSMDAEELIDRFLEIRHRVPNTWAMFHHRYTTHGTSTKGNCHPFRVGGSEDIVLGHNGIIPIEMADDEKRSDTRVFAEDMLPDYLEFLDDEDGFDMLQDFIGWSKVAIFSLSDRLEKNVYILNESMGHWDRGIWWSNDSYKPSRWDIKPLWKYNDTPAESDAEYGMSEWWKNGHSQQCVYCMTFASDREWDLGICQTCDTCFECANDLFDCECDRSHLSFEVKRYKHWWEDAEEGVVIA